MEVMTGRLNAERSPWLMIFVLLGPIVSCELEPSLRGILMGSLLVCISFLIVMGRTSFEIGCNFNSNSRFFFSGYDNFLGL